MFHLAIPPVNGLTVTTPTPGLRQVVPPFDLLRVAVAEPVDDDRVPDDAVVALLVPVLVDQPLVDEIVDVVAGVEDHAVGGKAVGHRLALGRRRTVGRTDVDVVTRRRLAKLFDQPRQHRPRRRVRHEVERDRFRPLLGRRGCGARGRRDEGGQHGRDPHELLSSHTRSFALSPTNGPFHAAADPLSIGEV